MSKATFNVDIHSTIDGYIHSEINKDISVLYADNPYLWGDTFDNINSFVKIEKLQKIFKLEAFKLISNNMLNTRSILLKHETVDIYISFYSANNSLYVYFPTNEPFAKKQAEYIISEANNILKKRTERLARAKVAKVNLVIATLDGLKLQQEKLVFNTKTVDVSKHYNDKFANKYDKLCDYLGTINKSGLHLLHGLPGCGKTTLLKLLMSKDFNGKKVLYISPDMAGALSSPRFIPFIMEYGKNSIIIIEDAETALAPRDSESSDATTNLLNMSDGILGDILNVQIICTFNTGKDAIDEALLRPGRLLTENELSELEVEKANILLEELGKAKTTKPMRICNIYNDEVHEENTSKIGF